MNEQEPKIVDVEVVAEPPPVRHSPASRRYSAHAGTLEAPPIHALSALLLVVVDNLWTLPEFLAVSWVVTIPLCFITVVVPVLLIQKVVKRQRFGTAFGYSVLLAAIAAVPTSLLGTPVGLALLAWTGISRLWGGNRERGLP